MALARAVHDLRAAGRWSEGRVWDSSISRCPLRYPWTYPQHLRMNRFTLLEREGIEPSTPAWWAPTWN